MTAKKIYRMDLALQGGGSHGAFTWGGWMPYWKTGLMRLKASVAPVRGR